MNMSMWRLIRASVRHYFRMNLSVACGVAAATAVIVGALLVGDSVRGSLRQLTLDRLGRIEDVIISDHFFRGQLAQEIPSSAGFSPYYDKSVAVIVFPQITAESRHGDQFFRASQIMTIGCDADFWKLDVALRTKPKTPGPGEIVLNEPLAKELSVSVGDEVTLRLPKATQLPADSPLAHKSDRINSLSGLKVIEIVPAEGLGRFDLRPSQSVPRNAFVATKTLQEALDVGDKINSVLISAADGRSPLDLNVNKNLETHIPFQLDDFGVKLERVRREFQPVDAADPEVAFEYFSVTTDRMLFSTEATDAIQKVVSAYRGQPVLTYLSNNIERVTSQNAASANGDDASNKTRPAVPYSTVAAIDFGAGFPLRDMDGREIAPLSREQIVLNSWTADQMGVKVGDRISLTYFEPETTHGQAIEAHREFTLAAITSLVEPSKPYQRKRSSVYQIRPALGNDAQLTPTVQGITDQESMDNWDPPFPFDYSRKKPEDDDYWKKHRTTPKAFISLSVGQELWGSRFGSVTSFRVPANQVSEADLRVKLTDALHQSISSTGINITAIKQKQLDAAKGSTPFDMLFLSLSFFVIAAALMLVGILFRLGIEQRASELGVLGAVGLRPKWIERASLGEGLIISTAGACFGTLLGIGYAWLMLAGLRTWWLGAITTPFLNFHWSVPSLFGGWFAGVAMSLLTIFWGIRQLRSVSPKRLLAGVVSDDSRAAKAAKSKLGARVRPIIIAAPVIALGLAGYATQVGGMAQAGSFVGAGAILLTAELLAIWTWLRTPSVTSSNPNEVQLSLRRLGFYNAKRSPGRSTATIALVASASFLIIALSSFRLAPTERGAGGFDLVAQSSEPVFTDLNDSKAREEILAGKASALKGSDIFAFRLRAGDDASCNNLYQSAQPRVIGVSSRFAEFYDNPTATSFLWAGSAASNQDEAKNPWHVLDRGSEKVDASQGQAIIPVVIDKNTAMYSLHLYFGIGEEFEVTYDGAKPIRFRVAGLLENSILQGSLVISERDFKALFPDVSGYRYFLLRTPRGSTDSVAAALEDQLSDQGFDTTPTTALLEQLLAVQNTYLSTFQSLGALGLLLGTFGLAAVQLRNVFERRKELAVLRATGFAPARVMKLVIWENVFLLISGLACGVVAAALAVLPHKIFGDSSIPFSLIRDLALMLGIVMVVGISTSVLAGRGVVRMPLLQALRSE